MNKQQLAAKIWQSANKMRSKIEANEYKDYILGFIFGADVIISRTFCHYSAIVLSSRNDKMAAKRYANQHQNAP